MGGGDSSPATSLLRMLRESRAPSPHPPAWSSPGRPRGAAAGVMLTASHNTYPWLGIKLKERYGGSASARTVKEVERCLAEESRLPRVSPNPRLIEVVDLKPAYLARLAELVDLDRIAAAGLRLAIDPMHGSGAGYLKALLDERGIAAVEVPA